MVLKENSQINTCFVNFTEILLLVYLFFALLAFFCNTVETDFKGRKITIIQSLVFETSFSCTSCSESKVSHFLLQYFLIHLFQLLKSLILKILMSE